MVKFLTRFLKKKEKAFSLIEIMLAVFIFTLFSTGVLYLSLDVLQRDAKLPVYNEALLYAQEGLEATRNIRDQNYLDLTTGNHGLLKESTGWTFDGTTESIDSYYYRTISVEDVYRDVDGEIADSGVLDPEMKKATSTVTWMWKGVFPKTVALSTYLSGWVGDEWMVTTCTEFSAGAFTDISSLGTTAPPEDNCALQLQVIEGPGDFYQSVDIGEHGNDVEVENGYAYVASNKNNEGLVVADVSDPLNPTVLVKENVKGKGRYITKDGDYLYVGVQDNHESIVVLDVSSPETPSVEDYVDLGAYGNNSAASGNYLFTGIDHGLDAFNILNISTPTAVTFVDSLSFGSSVNSVEIDGNYAYVGTGNTGAGFQVVDISTPNAPIPGPSINVGGAVNSIDVYGSFAFVGVDSYTDSLKIVDISTPTAPSILNSVNTGDRIEDLEYYDGYIYAAQDDVSAGLAIFNAGSPISPYVAAIVDIVGKATGVDVDNDMVYMSVDVNNRGLVILEAVEGGYAPVGDYTSEVLDTGSTDTRYNYLEWEASVPTGSSLEFQIRTASTSGGISSATWVGPDGTNSTYFDASRTAITIDPSASGVQYFQFKAYLTSDQESTPNIESVIVNYNP